MKIKFIVDSACDIPADVAESHQIRILPAYVNFNGESHADDGKDLDRTDYYEMLKTADPIPTTSSMSVGLVEEALHEAFKTADHVILVSIAASLSSINNTMRLAMEKFPEGTCTLFDTETLSGSGGLQATVAAEVAQETGDLVATLNALEQTRSHSVTFAAGQTVEYLRRGGRVSWTAGMIGGLLRIRPVVIVREGRVDSLARVRKYRAWIDVLAEAVHKYAPLERVVLLHANNKPALDDLHSQIADVLPDDVRTVIVTPSVGTHIGPGAIGLGLISKNKIVP